MTPGVASLDSPRQEALRAARNRQTDGRGPSAMNHGVGHTRGVELLRSFQCRKFLLRRRGNSFLLRRRHGQHVDMSTYAT